MIAERASTYAASAAILSLVLALTGAAPSTRPRASSHPDLAPIPAFARIYRTSCSTCHTAAPKLNVLGEAFRLNGYRFPVNDELLRKDESIPLGSDPWKDLWPRAIWPGELPDRVPLALGVRNDVRHRRGADAESGWRLLFPEEVWLAGGGSLGELVAAYVAVDWTPGEGLDVEQAKVEFQDVVPGLPARSLNLWVGLQELYALTFGNPRVDRAGRQGFRWQEFGASDLELLRPGAGDSLHADYDFQLGRSRAAIELNGLARGRLYYGLGVGRSAGATLGHGRPEDVYYKIRYKLGGLRFDGAYDGPMYGLAASGGQLLDRSLVIEHFGYFGSSGDQADGQGGFRALGVSTRAFYGRIDVGAGAVWARKERPWGASVGGELTYASVFAKGEYLLFPWLLGSLKFEWFDVDVGLQDPPAEPDQTRLLPGIIALVRPNVRVVSEAELFMRAGAASADGTPRPHSLWFRLEVAF